LTITQKVNAKALKYRNKKISIKEQLNFAKNLTSSDLKRAVDDNYGFRSQNIIF